MVLSVVMKRRLRLLLSWLSVIGSGVAAMDPVHEIGYCKRLRTPPDASLVHANEGVWFPQYRSLGAGVKDFSCHTLYEELSRSHEDGELSLKQTAFFTMRNKAIKEPKVTILDRTDERGVYTIDEFLSGHGMATKYHVMIKITPDIRLRYVCTNSTEVRRDFDLVYIETRRSVGLMKDIMAGVQLLKKTGLKANLVKINQVNCTRPLSTVGYDESLFFDDS